MERKIEDVFAIPGLVNKRARDEFYSTLMVFRHCEVLPAGIRAMHIGRSVLVMMPKMVVMVVVVMVMVIAVLSMIPRRVRTMDWVRRVGGSQRQRVHPLFIVADGRGERADHATQA